MKMLQRTITTFHNTRDEARKVARDGNVTFKDFGCDKPKGHRWATIKELTHEEAVDLFHQGFKRSCIEKQTLVCTKPTKNWYVKGAQTQVKVIIKRKAV